MTRPFAWAGSLGIAAVTLYVGATVLGGFLDPNYSHIRDAISVLTAFNAPNWAVLAPIYVAYNIVLAGFAVAIDRGLAGARLSRLAIGLFVLAGVSGIGQVTLFRMDLVGSPTTAAGQGHVALAATSALLTVAAAITYGFAFRPDRAWRALSRLSFLAAAALLATGPAAAMSIGSAYMGLFERITIGVMIAWVLVMSIGFMRAERQATQRTAMATAAL